MLDKIGGRKVVITVFVTLVGVLLSLVKGDVPVNLLSLLQVIVGAFVVGNIGEHAAGRKKQQGQDAPSGVGPAAPAAFPQEIGEKLASLEQGLATAHQALSIILKQVGGK